VSRSPAIECKWIKADISTPEGIQYLITQIGQMPIDALLFSGGVWEERGFMECFDFRKTSDIETRHILSVNLMAPIEITKGSRKVFH
jgi:short-subunit dehydrogenase